VVAVSDFLPLAGVIVGAGCTGGVQAWHEARRERRELRASARLLLEELATNNAVVQWIVEKQALPTKDDDHLILRRDMWETHKQALAGIPDLEPWGRASAAYFELRHLELAMNKTPGHPMGDIDMSDLQRKVAHAMNALRPQAD